jgi:hypothetical protein
MVFRGLPKNKAILDKTDVYPPIPFGKQIIPPAPTSEYFAQYIWMIDGSSKEPILFG